MNGPPQRILKYSNLSIEANSMLSTKANSMTSSMMTCFIEEAANLFQSKYLEDGSYIARQMLHMPKRSGLWLLHYGC